jgi:citrate synthase
MSPTDGPRLPLQTPEPHTASAGDRGVTRAHEGVGAGQASRATPWSTAITATTDHRVFVRGVALDEAIGRDSFPAMLLLLWRGEVATEAEADLMGACMVAAIDHGPLAPSALVVRTIASTRASPMSALAGGILTFGDLHGAVVSRAMELIATAPTSGSLDEWADQLYQTERDAGRRLPGIGHRWHERDLRAEQLLEMTMAHHDGRLADAVTALAARVAKHVGHPVAVNIDGALAVALIALRLDVAYGDFLFAISRSLGLAAHIVEERARERPMRMIDPTAALYDGIPVTTQQDEETAR